MPKTAKEIVDEIVTAFRSAKDVDAKGKKTYLEVADAAYVNGRGLPRKEQLAMIRGLIEYVLYQYNFALNYVVPQMPLPPFIREFVNIVTDRKLSVEEKSEKLLDVCVANSKLAQADLAGGSKPAETVEVPQQRDLRNSSEDFAGKAKQLADAEEKQAEGKNKFNPIKSMSGAVSRGATRITKNVTSISTKAKKAVFGSSTPKQVVPATREQSAEIAAGRSPTSNKDFSRQLVSNYQDLTYDLLDYVGVVHEALFTISKTLDGQNRLTEAKYEEFKEYSSALQQVATALSREPDGSVDEKTVKHMIDYTANVIDVANRLEREYRSVSVAQQKEFSAQNSWFVNKIIGGISGLIGTLLTMKEAAHTFVSDKIKHVKKNVYTTSDAGKAASKGVKATSAHETVQGFKAAAQDVLDFSKELRTSPEVATVKKSNKFSAKMKSLFSGVFSRLRKANDKLEERVETNMQYVSGKDVGLLVENIDSALAAGNVVATSFRAVTGKPAKQLEEYQAHFAVRSIDATTKLMDKVKDVLGVRKAAPIDPDVIAKLNDMKGQVYTRVINMRDLKRDQ